MRNELQQETAVPPLVISQAGSRLLNAIGTPANLDGAALAARQLLQSMRSGQLHFAESISSAWIDEAVLLQTALRQAADAGQPRLLTLTAALKDLSVFGHFVSPVKVTVPSAQAAKINGAIAVIVVACASAGRAVPAGVAAAWSKLLKSGDARKGRHADWSYLAENVPATTADMQNWLHRTTEAGIRSLVTALIGAIEIPILPPTALNSPPARDDGQVEATELAGHLPTNARESPASSPNPDADQGDAPESLVGWLRSRAQHSGYLARFGAEGRWEKLSIQELSAVCPKIKTALQPDNPDRDLAFFAVLTLASSLSPKLALNIGVGTRGTDVWLNPELGAIQWCLRRLLDSHAGASLTTDTVADADIVDIWLPEAAAIKGRLLTEARPRAKNVLELITGGSDTEHEDAFLQRYRPWLHSLGFGSLHDIEEARFARAIGQVYRRQSGDVVAGLLGLDFDECSVGMLEYVRLSTEFTHAQCDLAYQTIGLGRAVSQSPPPRAIGSSVALSTEKFSAGLSSLHTEAAQLNDVMRAADSIEELQAAHHLLVHVRLLQVISLSGGRGQRVERLTWGAVFGHEQHLQLADKDIDKYSASRRVPICTHLRHVLDSHAEELDLFCSRARQMGTELANPRGVHFGNRGANRHCFATARLAISDGKTSITRQGPNAKLLSKISQKHFGAPINVGRHTLITLTVIHGFDSPLIKVFTGHFTGRAEVFSDGQWISPADALALLQSALNWVITPLCPARHRQPSSGVIELSSFAGRLPPQASEGLRAGRSTERVLAPPFDALTPVALRSVDHLRDLLFRADGPADAHANLLANLLLVAWIPLQDIRTLWHSESPFSQVERGVVIASWQRELCRAEIRRPLVGSAALALHQVAGTALGPSWSQACAGVRTWVAGKLPSLSWPDGALDAVASLGSLMTRWLRMHVSPFLLTAASPRLAAPTASTSSVLRIARDSVVPAGQQDALIFPAPTSRRSGRIRIASSALTDAMDLVRDHASRTKTDGENWERMKNLAAALRQIDPSRFAPSVAYIDWALAEAELWKKSEGGRIRVTSLDTYSNQIKPALATLRSNDSLHSWFEEWFDFFDHLKNSVRAASSEERDAQIEARLTAARRFVGTLSLQGYSIPSELLGATGRARSSGMRASAAATLILEADQLRVTRLMASHFKDLPLESKLAPLYADQRWEISCRSIEAAVTPLGALSVFDQVIITTDGFAHLKSDNARRATAVDPGFADRFRTAAAMVAQACPGARWMFLLDDRHDWSVIDGIETAFSAALKQVTGAQEARAHATRAVLPLALLFPGWEPMLRKFLQGKATTSECADFCKAVRQLGFNHLISVLFRTGHGHPVTFATYYFAIWDLLLSVYAQASLAGMGQVESVASKVDPKASAALRQSKARAKQAGRTAFDGWHWATTYIPASSALPRLAEKDLAPPVPAQPVVQSAHNFRLPLISACIYLALRFTGKESVAAAFSVGATTGDAAMLETLIDGAEVGHIRARHQAKVSAGGTKAEATYLLSSDGLKLAQAFAAASGRTLMQFGDALSPRRSGAEILPSAAAIRRELASFAACLPADLAVLVQFGKGRLTAADLAQIESPELRVFIGPADPDLGARPRISVVPATDRMNLVLRARRTANARCLIAALQLLRIAQWESK